MTRKAAAHTSQYAEEKPSVNYVSLSKAMSKALRHQPQRLGITLAPDGSVSLDEFIGALNRRGGWPRAITEADIMQVVEHGSKQRFAVEGGRIRARYGHSVPLAINYELANPPDVLYHGTSERFLETIMAEGLLPMGRQVVHLSSDVETAQQVGRRHGGRTVILTVDAARAAQDGIRFYRGNDSTWLADRIPACHLRKQDARYLQ
jgi:putative RNA 2'-phosphotransferase